MDELLKNVNGQTIKYLIDSLNGKVNRANTLITKTGEELVEVQTEFGTVYAKIQKVYDDYSSAISESERELRTTFRKLWLADIKYGSTPDEDRPEETGDVVGTIELASMQTDISQTAGAVDIIAQRTDGLETFYTTFQFTSAGFLISQAGSRIKLRLTASRIELVQYDNDDPDVESEEPQVITYWTYDKFLLPTAVQIPTGGNFQIGQFRAVPRTGHGNQPGNLSIVKV